ncbi:hypothetical protein FRC04_010003 [Tulasnella sp. 424]|nr:hypothetical protein FRC04_010003 [Tulasnella sp. 424]KAG8972794.1 hypothetical protein FRC05_009516 [Tulasnella sp. 425]
MYSLQDNSATQFPVQKQISLTRPADTDDLCLKINGTGTKDEYVTDGCSDTLIFLPPINLLPLRQLDLRYGENKGHAVHPLERKQRPSRRKGLPHTGGRPFVKSIIREVTGFAPYERRIMELLRNNKDKKAKKLTKKRLGTITRAKKKLDELGTILAESRRAH